MNATTCDSPSVDPFDLRITNGSIILPDVVKDDTDLLIRDGAIAGLIPRTRTTHQARTIDARGGYVAPGFIDIHVHGGGGFGIRGENLEDFPKMLAFHARGGTTGLLPTISGAPTQEMLRGIAKALDTMGREGDGAAILGIFLEGPYGNPIEAGGMATHNIRNPDPAEYHTLYEACQGQLKQMMIAPELPGADEFIRFMVQRGVVVGVSHSRATYEQVAHAATLGLSHVIHTFNGILTGIMKRRPGVMGASLVVPGLTNEIIADGRHVHPANIELLLKARGVHRVMLVTDAVEIAGLGDGIYTRPDGRNVEVKNGYTKIVGETKDALAGSVALADECVRTMASIGCSLPDVMKMASTNPARHLGLEDRKGSITIGKDADLVVLDRDLHARLTLRGGKVIFEDAQW